MKKILIITLLTSLRAIAQDTNQPYNPETSYTNNLAQVRLQPNDALYLKLLTIKRITGDTNGLNVIATNHLTLTLKKESNELFENAKRNAAIQIIQLPGDDGGLKLKRIQAILNEP